VFESFDTTPLAAASLGQVHRATLSTAALKRFNSSAKTIAASMDESSATAAATTTTTTTAASSSSSSSSSSASALSDFSFEDILSGKAAKELRRRRTAASVAAAGGSTTSGGGASSDDEVVAVAVKVQREGLRPIYDLDLGLIEKIAKFCDKLNLGVGGAGQRWMDIFEEAKEILYREIDYRTEAENALRFSRQIEGLDWVTTPRVFPELCTEKLLVMEYLPGIKINDVDALDKGLTVDEWASGETKSSSSSSSSSAAASSVPKYNRKALASNLAKCYLYQFCKDGFFNTDPHPGNLAVDDGIPGGRIIFYDFGQACALSGDQSEGVLETVEAIVDLDAKACVKGFDKLGVLKEGANLEQVEEVIRKNFESGRIKSKASAKKGGSGEVEADAEGADGKGATSKEAEKASAKAMPEFTLPAQLAFVARALTQMDGVGKVLDPEFEFIAAAAPAIAEIKGGDVYAREFIQKKFKKMFNA
jgi:predicted unusual protein kinase regulating ubiquinone biosynthesis (AarF/ABC1/UbiB family)